MPINTLIREAGPYTGNGVSTGPFVFTFKVFHPSDIDIWVRAAGLPNAEIVPVGDYTVTLNADQELAPGGYATLDAPLEDQASLWLVSDIPETQEINWLNQGRYRPDLLNEGFDKVTALIQQHHRQITDLEEIVAGDGSPQPPSGPLAHWTEQFTAAAGQTVFATQNAYIPGHVNTYLNGVRLTVEEVTAASGNTVVLTEGATAGDLVVVEAFFGGSASPAEAVAQRIEVIATAGQTTIGAPLGFEPGYLSVFVNGAKLANADFDDSDGATVVLAQPLTAGDIVQLEGFLGAGTATDAAQMSFIQSGGGAYLRSAQDKMRDIAHAFDFIDPSLHAGIAAGTNLDDLSAELNAAFAAHPLIRLPTVGTLNIASSLFVPSGGGIIGGGARSIIKALPNWGNGDVVLMHTPLIRNATYLPATLAERDKGLTFRDFKIDGNRANNPSGTEFNHGIHLNAVDGVDLNVWAVDLRGEGVLFSYARGLGDGATSHYDIGCRGMRGFIRADDCYRQGVAIVCGEEFDLFVVANRAGYFAFDIEPDQTASYARDGKATVIAKGCGVNGNFAGGVSVTGTNFNGTGAADVRNIAIELLVRDCNGAGGVQFRDCSSVSFRGSIAGQTNGSGVYGVDSGFSSSNVSVDLTIGNCSGDAFVNRGPGNIINGRIAVYGGPGSGIHIQEAAGGTIQAVVKGVTGQGIILYNSDDFVFPSAVVSGCGSHGVWVRNTSARNNFPNLISIGSTFGWGFIEEAGCDNNRSTNARLTGNSAGAASLQGTSSVVIGQEVGGKIAYDPPSLPGLSGTNVDVFMAVQMGDHVTQATTVATDGILRSPGIQASNKVTVEWFNCRATAMDGAAGSLECFATPKVVGPGTL